MVRDDCWGSEGGRVSDAGSWFGSTVAFRSHLGSWESGPGTDRGRTSTSLGAGFLLSFTGSLKIFVALHPCDLRKRFNGLHGLVAERLQEDPRSGALFVFSNQRRTRLKILYWDGTGFWVMTKRLRSEEHTSELQ